jgi:hypothetical protein
MPQLLGFSMGALRGRDNSAPQGRVCLSPKKEFDFKYFDFYPLILTF